MVGISIKNRYTIRAILGQGGMGVVYHAYDTIMRRDVALKTLRDVPSTVFLDLFARECSILAAMVHPNVVEIFDMGEFDENGVSKPYFVMPLLPGSTLNDLIYPANLPISPARCVDIVTQVCRGLQAAHERELIHQDIKPRNIFVMRDDAVKIIDFGVSHLNSGNSTGIRGTPHYMSPEQISFKGVTPKSDIFSLAVVCYEALTATHPFLRRPERRDTQAEIAEAITTFLPPLASELNPSVSRSVAQVVAKGMAKDPLNRFDSAASFAEALQKALRNENPGATRAVVRTRLERARKSFEQNDLQLAGEIVAQLEADGHTDPEIGELRQTLDAAVQRERSEGLLAAAERCFTNEEYTLALRKIVEVLGFDSANPAALALKKRVDSTIAEQKVSELLRIATERLEQAEFANARHAIQDALRVRPSDARARQLLNDVDLRQKELLRQRQEQERLFQSAQAAFFAGKIEQALGNLDQLAELTAKSGEVRERSDDYKELYRRVQAEHEALTNELARARALLDQDLPAAQRICDRFLAKYPDYPDFLAVKQEIEQRRAHAAEAFRQNVAAQVAKEARLDVRLRILEDARRNAPKDEFFARQIDNLRELMRKVDLLSNKARNLERQQDFSGAIKEWENTRSIYAQLPGLDDDLARLQNLLERQRAERKAIIINRIEGSLAAAAPAHDTSDRLLKEAELEFPNDADLAKLRKQLLAQIERGQRVNNLLSQAREANKRQNFPQAVAALADAGDVAGELAHLHKAIFDESLAQADSIGRTDWRSAKAILDSIAKLGTPFSIPAKYWDNIRARQRDEAVAEALNLAESERAGDLLQARATLTNALQQFPGETRLQNKLSQIEKEIQEQRRLNERKNDLLSLYNLQDELIRTEDLANLPSFVDRNRSIAQRYKNDPEIAALSRNIAEQVSAISIAADALAKDDLKTCFRVCDEALAKHHDHRSFINLKAQAEELEREKAAEYLEQVTRQLAATPDLAKRSEILEAALRQYPAEPYFAEELQLVRNQRQLIQNIFDRAQSLEKDNFIPEALEQWTDLKALDPQDPGVDRAIERCHNALHQKREQSRLASLDVIDQKLNNRDYQHALELCREAQAEFPEDEELARVAKFINERLEGRSLALDLLKQAEAEFARGQFQLGLEQSRAAIRTAADEADILKSSSLLLVKHTGTALLTDYKTAEAMVAEAKKANPDLVISKKLRQALQDAQIAFDLKEFRAGVGLYEMNEDFPAALELARQFLSKYPAQPEAVSVQNRLLQAKTDWEKRQQREQVLSELTVLATRAKGVEDVTHLLDFSKRAEQIARQNTADETIPQVASRVSNLLNSVAQIRQLSADDRLQDAETLCYQSISEFPDETVFGDLRAEIELRQVERSSEYLRQIESKLAAEQDFGRQEQILQEAVRAYPSEPYYGEELTLVRNKQALLDAEISRARRFESEGLHEDALREWENLRRAYPWHSGLRSEADRARTESEKQNAAVRKSTLENIQRALSTGDLELADLALNDARATLAGDPVLADLKNQIERLRKAHAERRELAFQGRNAFNQGRVEDGANLLARAAQIVNDDLSFRDLMLDHMLNEAEALSAKNWHGADILLKEVARLHPGYPVPPELKSTVEATRKDYELARFLELIEQALKTGNFNEAKRIVDAATQTFPNDSQIAQRRTAVYDHLQQVALRQAREVAQNQFEQLMSRVRSADTSRKLSKLRSSNSIKGFQDSEDPQIRDFATLITSEIDKKINGLAESAGQVSALRRFWFVPVAVVALMIGLVAFWLRPSPGAHKSTETNPSAVVTPPSPVIQIAGNVATGDVYLDEKKVGALAGGSLDLFQLSQGDHKLRIASTDGSANITISEDSSNGPRITAPISAEHLFVTTLSSNGQSSTITTNLAGGESVAVDNQNVGTFKSGGSLALPNLQAGNHQLTIGSADNAMKFDVVVQTKPSISVLIGGRSPNGTLEVKTNVPGVDVFIDGNKQKLNGDRSFRFVLPAKSYEVYATRDGYTPSEKAQVAVDKGSQVAVTLKLTPKPSILEIAPLPAGTAVMMNGVALDNLGQRNRPLPAGTYVFEVSRSGFVTKRFQRILEPGQKANLTKDDFDLVPSKPDPLAQEAEDWNRVKAGRNLTEMNAYLQKFPAGAHAQQAKEAVQQLEWEGVDKSNNAALDNYLKTHPGGSHAGEARQLLDQLSKSDLARRELAAWDALDKHSKESLESFVGKYPNGLHTDAAKSMLSDLAKQAEQSFDDSAWRAVNRTDPASIQKYVSEHPSGKHLSQAQAVLAALTQRQATQLDAQDVLATLQKYANAWAQKDVATLVDLQPSLRKSGKGMFDGVRSWRMTLVPSAAPQINGDRASVTCRRQVSQTFSDGTKKVIPETNATYSLKKQTSGWVIDDVN